MLFQNELEVLPLYEVWISLLHYLYERKKWHELDQIFMIENLMKLRFGVEY